MNDVIYLKFGEINPTELLPLLNSEKIRTHLIVHDLFTTDTLADWINSKIGVNSISGCKVKGIICDDELSGWCGIQLGGEKYEIVIILDEKFWGLGRKVFQDMMGWSKKLGCDEVNVNFLHTRPEYKFLKKNEKSVPETELFGANFVCYQLFVR